MSHCPLDDMEAHFKAGQGPVGRDRARRREVGAKQREATARRDPALSGAQGQGEAARKTLVGRLSVEIE